MKKKTQGFVIVTESYKQERNMQKTSTAKMKKSLLYSRIADCHPGFGF